MEGLYQSGECRRSEGTPKEAAGCQGSGHKDEPDRRMAVEAAEQVVAMEEEDRWSHPHPQ